MIKVNQIKAPRRLSDFATGLFCGAECLELKKKSQICLMTSQTTSWHVLKNLNQISSQFDILIKLKGYMRQSILCGLYILNSSSKGINPHDDITRLDIDATNGKNKKPFSIRMNKLTVRNIRNAEGHSKLNLIDFLFAQCYITKCCR